MRLLILAMNTNNRVYRDRLRNVDQLGSTPVVFTAPGGDDAQGHYTLTQEPNKDAAATLGKRSSVDERNVVLFPFKVNPGFSE